MSRTLSILILLACISLAVPASATWQPGGNVVCSATGDRYSPAMIADGTGGVYCAWEDIRSGASQIYMQRIDGDGNDLWQADGVPITEPLPVGTYPQLVSDGAGGVMVLWHDGHFRVTRVDATGAAVWPEAVAVRPTGSAARWARIVADGSGGVIVAWQDRSVVGEYGVFAQHLDGAGTRLWGDDALRISDYEGDPEMAPDGSGGAFVAWSDRRDPMQSDVYVQHVSGDGTVQWPVNGVGITPVEHNQAYARLVGDGTGGVIVVWLDIQVGGDTLIAQRLSPAGTPLWSSAGITVGDHGWWYFAIGRDGNGGAIVAWQGEAANQKVRVQRLDANGNRLWPAVGAPVADHYASQKLPVMLTHDDGTSLLAWQDQRNGGCRGIYAQKLTAGGTRAWAADGVMVTDRDLHQYSPRLARGGPEEMLVFWRDPDDPADLLYLMPVGATTEGVSEDCSLPPSAVPDAAATLQLTSWPNPFNPRTEFHFTLPVDGHAQLVVHDLGGRRIATLVDGWHAAGDHRITWEGRDAGNKAVPAGVYFANLRQAGGSVTHKAVLIR